MAKIQREIKGWFTRNGKRVPIFASEKKVSELSTSGALHKYGLPQNTTQEQLEMQDYIAIKYGNSVAVAGYRHDGSKPAYYGAVYSYEDEKHDIDSPIALNTASDASFTDPGSAVKWAMNNAGRSSRSARSTAKNR